LFDFFPFLQNYIIEYVNYSFKDDLKDMESIKQTYLNRERSPKGNFWVLVERKSPLVNQTKNGESIENCFDKTSSKNSITVNHRSEVIGFNATICDKFQDNNNIEEIIHGTLGLQYIDDDTAELRRMSVSKEFRKRGFATHLLVDFLIPFAEKEGFKKIVLTTHEIVRSARKLYENCKFQLVRRKILEEKLAIPDPLTGKTEMALVYYERLLDKSERDREREKEQQENKLATIFPPE